MSTVRRALKAGVAIMVLTMCGCASGGSYLRPEGPKGYMVSVTSAVYAGSSTRGGSSADLYFGDRVVRDRGGDQGDFQKKPRGAVITFWSASEKGTEEYEIMPGEWVTRPINKRFYYATALPSQLAPYPAKTRGHQHYGIYVSAGKTVVGEKGLRPEDAPQATAFVTGRAKLKHYVFGREDTVYYKILSQGADPIAVGDDPSPWHTLPGVALTEAQYMEMSSCNPDTLTGVGGKPCRAFLSLDDPDLTPKQREYIRQQPITRDDIKPLIREFKKAARISDRWA